MKLGKTFLLAAGLTLSLLGATLANDKNSKKSSSQARTAPARSGGGNAPRPQRVSLGNGVRNFFGGGNTSSGRTGSTRRQVVNRGGKKGTSKNSKGSKY